MEIRLRNIGKIAEANVSLNGITVIAGENNTGKSTVGKTLYTMFQGFYNMENQINRWRRAALKDIIKEMFRVSVDERFNDVEISDVLANSIISQILDPNNQDDITGIVQKTIGEDEDNNKQYSKKILDIKTLAVDEIFPTYLSKIFDIEFHGKVNNIYMEDIGEINLKIGDQEIKVKLKHDIVEEINNPLHIDSEAIYIDNPFILDEELTQADYPYNKRQNLINKLFAKKESWNPVTETLTNKKLQSIYQILDKISVGQIIKGKDPLKWEYKEKNSDKLLDVKSLSTGLKTFVIIKTLLLNGVLKENGILILDEPEIHLHPEWQLIFAELIILLQKEYGMYILLNTHSPYFLYAIEAYSCKHDIKEKCKYYVAENKGNLAYIEDVTDNIEAIYEKLARPFQKIEDIRYEVEYA